MNFKSITLAVLGLGLGAAMSAQDVQTFTYSTPDGKSGLRMAWRTDSTEQWQPIDRVVFSKEDVQPSPVP